MSLRKYNNRKRRHTQAFPEEQHDAEETNEQQQSPTEAPTEPVPEDQPDVTMNEKDPSSNVNGEEDEAVVAERAAKELAVWEIFHEEHYEVLEQLPLSLHRAYTLIQELDMQVEADNEKILKQTQKYISMRQALAHIPTEVQAVPMLVDEQPLDQAPAKVENHTSPTEPPESESPPPISPSKRPRVRSRTSTGGASRAARERDAQKPAPPPPSPPPPETTRSVIADLARRSEQVMRAANEKLNVARFACDLIDRYIRDMDREIKEQETSLSLGLRPGTHPASIVLPDVILPKPARPTRAQDTPFSDGEMELELELESPQMEDGEADGTLADGEGAEGALESQDTSGAAGMQKPTQGATQPKRRPRRSHGWSRKKPDHPKEREKDKEKEKENANELETIREEVTGTEAPEAAAEVEAKVASEMPPPPPPPPPLPQILKLTLTLPPLSSLQPQQQPQTEPPLEAELVPIDPDEERYCYCNGISWGEMVGCDGCNGWFHLTCIDQNPIPEGSWYCKNCAPTKGHGKRAKHTRKRRYR